MNTTPTMTTSRAHRTGNLRSSSFVLRPWKTPLLALLLLGGLAGSLRADTHTWDGSSSGNWDAAANWTNGTTPQNGDDLIFPAGAARLVTTNNNAVTRIRSITITGSGYTLRGTGAGTSITLSNGITATAAGSMNTLELDVTLGAAQSFECAYSTAGLYVNGSVELGSFTLTTVGAGEVRLSGVISGTGGLTKHGSGTHWLLGASANSYTGPTRVYSGTLMLAKSGGNAVRYGELTIGMGLGSPGSALVRELSDYQIGTIPITINSDGYLDIGNDTVGDLIFNGGQVNVETGLLALGGSLTVLYNADAQARISATGGGGLVLNTPRTFDIANTPFSPDLRIEVPISGAGGFTKTGNGALGLHVGNSFTGTATVNDGLVYVYHDRALGATNGGTVVGDGGVLVLANGRNVEEEGLTLNGAGDGVAGALTSIGGSNTWSGPVTLATDSVITVQTNRYLNLAGVVAGSAGFTKTGAGHLRLGGTNVYTQSTIIMEGGISGHTDQAFGAPTGGAGVVITNDGSLSLYDVDISDVPLTFAALPDVRLHAHGTCSWSGPVSLAENALIMSYDAFTLSGAISGNGGLYLSGDTIELSGVEDNTHAGGTTTSCDRLRLNKTGATAIPGSFQVGLGTKPTVEVQWLAHHQIANSAAVTFGTNGVLNLDGNSDVIGALTFNGGRVDTGAGWIRPLGTLTVNPTNVEAVINGRFSLGAVSHQFVIHDGSVGYDLRMNASVENAGAVACGFQKSGAGVLYLAASNLFTGAISVNEGYVYAAHDCALGSPAGGTTVNNGGALYLHTLANLLRECITLNGTGVNGNGALSAIGAVAVETNLVLGSDSVIWVGLGGQLTIAGAISGAGGFTKAGTGTLILSGATGNTYTGDTLVHEGVLTLGKTSGTAIRFGNLSIGDGLGGANADVVRYTANNQIWSGVPIAIAASGLLDLNGHVDGIGALTFTGGRATSGTGGLLSLGGDVTASASADSAASLEGSVRLDAVRTFNIANSTFSPDLRLLASVTGAGGIAKTGAGALGLSASNSFAGGVTVDAGLVYLYDDNALGTTAGGTVVSNGGVLVLANDRHVGAEPLTLNGDGDGTSGALASIGGSNSWSGTVTLATDATITVQTNRTLNLSGALTGPAGFLKAQPGVLRLSGFTSNSYAGTTHVVEGVLSLAKTTSDGAIPGDLEIGLNTGLPGTAVVLREDPGSSQINDAGTVMIRATGLLEFPGTSQEYVGALAGSGKVKLGNSELSVGYNHTAAVFTGTIDGAGGRVGKAGTGSWTLSGTNTYTGLTTVKQGTLFVNGVQPASDVEIQSLGMLGGTGVVGRVTSIGGVLSPGLSPGTLTSSNVLFDSTTDFIVELIRAGDRLNVRGKVGLDNASLVLSAPHLLPAEGQEFIILSNDDTDAITGTFAGLPEGALVTAGPRQFRITYSGDTGNDVVLIATNTAALHPTLSVWSTATNTVVIAWPQSDLAWQLHAATNLLATPAFWTELPPPYVTNGANLEFTEPAPAGNKFYRLHTPWD